jgi:hypothetical protein
MLALNSTYFSNIFGTPLNNQTFSWNSSTNQWNFITPSASTYTAGTGLTLTGSIFSLSSPVSIANGGTNNSSTYTSGSIIYSNGTSLT